MQNFMAFLEISVTFMGKRKMLFDLLVSKHNETFMNENDLVNFSKSSIGRFDIS